LFSAKAEAGLCYGLEFEINQRKSKPAPGPRGVLFPLVALGCLSGPAFQPWNGANLRTSVSNKPPPRGVQGAVWGILGPEPAPRCGFLLFVAPRPGASGFFCAPTLADSRRARALGHVDREQKVPSRNGPPTCPRGTGARGDKSWRTARGRRCSRGQAASAAILRRPDPLRAG
jgi:hypothetical protein